jgi:voltage-gated potassium channel Kch
MRGVAPGARVILVERNPMQPRLEALAAKYPVTVVIGDINNESTLAILQLQHARRIVLLTGSDLTNLHAAYQILERAPMLAGRIVLHLGNLGLLQTVHVTRAVQASAFFNSHEIAARQLVSAHLLARFARTERADLVVMAGFGRFGQCVLHALQAQAQDKFDQVLILDQAAQARVSSFEDRVGFAGSYTHHTISGNVLNAELWAQLEREFQLARREPLIVLGAHDDMLNLEAALWLRRRYPDAYIVVRQFNYSTFSAELSRELGLLMFSAAELITQAIPADWCVKPRGLGP